MAEAAPLASLGVEGEAETQARGRRRGGLSGLLPCRR